MFNTGPEFEITSPKLFSRNFIPLRSMSQTYEKQVFDPSPTTLSIAMLTTPFE